MSKSVSRRAACALGAGVAAAAAVPALSFASTAGRAPEAPGMADWVEKQLGGMSLREKVGQLFVTPVNGQSADEVNPKNRKEFGVDTPAQIVERYAVGGIIYFNNSDFDNIDTPRQIAALSNGLQQAAVSSNAKLPLLISTDQEGGYVARITGPYATDVPGNMAIGASRSTADAYAETAILGSELRAMGINQNHAPDADVNTEPTNPVIGLRSFSSHPELAAQLVRAAVRGYQESGPPDRTTSAAVKHFPGHGGASSDSHTSLPTIKRSLEQWRKTDAVPFRAAIKEGVQEVMSAHIVMPEIDPSGEPATLSPRMITGLLREELGYDGLISTDSLRMQGVRELHPDAEIPVLALKAGIDQLLMPVDLNLAINSVLKAVQDGKLTESRIEESARRVLRLKYQRGLAHYRPVDLAELPRRVGTAANRARAQAMTDHTITVVRNDAKLLPLHKKPRSVLITGWGETTTKNLAGAIGKRGANTRVLATGTEPGKAQITEAVAAANSAELTVVLTNGDPKGMQPQQQQLLTELITTGKPVIAVAAQRPYDTGFVDAQRTWLATYSSSAASMESLTKVIYGELGPRGKLPVDVPVGGDTTKIKYPFGTGLHW
ncbi:glycoside hydrolase family 3 protein [Sciscionella sediminilitoris]|uniref:glycoside hydrolase family 3 protein n=1 Tax=Sciscionella sediminilitoris TaxID=1445613 RepID=UPI000B2B4016|nr:glycoside hydrolase family 3 protein [Sciscionella sp. SE31]